MSQPQMKAVPNEEQLVKAKFTPAQKQFLADSLMEMNKHLFNGTNVSQAADTEDTFWGTPVEDLSKEERAKFENHPLDIWNMMVEHAEAGQIAEGINNFMFRHHGMFNVEPNSQGYMCRMRLPACMLRGDQFKELGNMAEEMAGGYSHVTTRGNLQFREIQPNNLINWIMRLYDYGLNCKATGADSARNITASPTAGFDPVEVADIHEYALKLSHRILNNRDLHGLPRKFNFSFDNGGSISCVSDTNDVGFVAINVLENDADVEPGVYCRLILGGITGHEDFARDTGVICKPEDTPEISEAILRVFLEHGDRTNRKKARLKYVLDANGFDWMVAQIQEKLDGYGNDVKLISLDKQFEAPRAPVKRQGHIGVHPQSQVGMNYIGVALKVGRMSPEQMRGLADVAMQYGQNDMRLTVWQNVLIPYVKDADVDDAVKAIEALGLSVSATAFAAGAVACTGKWGCKLANAYTKQDTQGLVEHLQDKFTLDQPINIHTTGCNNSCAQHYIGDIGLIGMAAEDGSEGYNVFVGGGCDQDQALARHLVGPIASRDLNEVGEKIIGNYLNNRDGDESFLSFTKRHDEAALKEKLLA